MNILPKKRWHVRTKENIARVRRDEAEAAEKEKQEKIRTEQADREARLNTLKLQSKKKLTDSGFCERDFEQPESSETHINLFDDLDHAVKTSNKEHDKEIKEKTEEYEKKIGYLTYLGQNTNEALKKKNWYEVPPDSSRYSRSSDIKDTYDKLVLKDKDGKIKEKELDEKDGEVSWKAKQRLDPINAFKKFCKSTKDISNNDKIGKAAKKETYTNGIKDSGNNKHKKNNKREDKLEKLQKLREARLKREEQEKQKTSLFLASRYSTSSIDKSEEISDMPPKIIPKYNSQFNPELARQNFRN